MQLSILIPTNRPGPAAVARVAQACSWAGPDIEVIVRDNSGNVGKRELLAHFKGEHCNIIAAEPCEPLHNTFELLRQARGEFIFFLADDDMSFDRAIQGLPRILDHFGKDPAVAGVTGHYALELANESAMLNYNDLDSEDAVARVAGYLSCPGPNVIYYSVLRRQLVQRTMLFMKTMPVFLSFHDQITSLLYLLSGRFVQLPRLLYVYDIGVWETAETAQRRDIDFYTAAGLDAAINKLHWILCGFEGAALIRHAALFPNYPLAQRQTMADHWFSLMYERFKNQERSAAGSRFTDDAARLCSKLQTSTRQLAFQALLVEICGLMELFAPDTARRYFEFWQRQIDRHKMSAYPGDLAVAS